MRAAVDKTLSAGPAGPAQRTWREGSLALTSPGDTAWAMSEENVETLNRIAAAWNRRDLEAWLGFMHPEIDWEGGFTRLEGAIYRGRDGMRGYWSQTNAALELVVSLDEVRDLGDTMLGLGHLRGRSQGGIPIDTQYGIVISFRDGLAVSGSDWGSHAEALVAAGLRE
jgi:ketosteroid isomerase-like protein